MLFKTGKKALFNHIERVKAITSVKSKVDRENIRILEEELDELAERYDTLSQLRVIVFVVLYASVASTIVSRWGVLLEVVQTVTAISGLLGAGLLSLIALYLTWRIAQIWNHMLVVYSHVIAIYEKHAKGTLQKE